MVENLKTPNTFFLKAYSGSNPKNVVFSFYVEEPCKYIKIRSSFEILEERNSLESIPFSRNNVTILNSEGTNEKISIITKNDKDSIIVMHDKKFESGSYSFYFDNEDYVIKKTSLREIEVLVSGSDSHDFSKDPSVILSTTIFSIFPKQFKSIIIESTSSAKTKQLSTSIIKFVDKFNNITEVSDEDAEKYLDVAISNLDGKTLSTGLKWKIQPSKSGCIFLSGIPMSEYGSYVIKLLSNGREVAKSNPIVIFPTEEGSVTRGIHWLKMFALSTHSQCKILLSRSFPTHCGQSISICTKSKDELCNMESWMSMIPVSYLCDVIGTHDLDSSNVISLKSRDHSTLISKNAVKQYISYKNSCDSKRSSSKYKEFSKLCSYLDSKKIISAPTTSFISLGLHQGISIETIIERYKSVDSCCVNKALCLLEISNTLDSETNNAIFTQTNAVKNEYMVTENLEKGMTYVSTGPKTIVSISASGHMPSKKAVNLNENIGLKYNRHFTVSVSSTSEIKSVYIIKNNKKFMDLKDKLSDSKMFLDVEFDDISLIEQEAKYYMIIKCKDNHVIVTSPIWLSTVKSK